MCNNRRTEEAGVVDAMQFLAGRSFLRFANKYVKVSKIILIQYIHTYGDVKERKKEQIFIFLNLILLFFIFFHNAI